MKKTKKETTSPRPSPPAERVTGNGEYRRVPLKEIVPSPYQARKTFDQSPDWAEFVASVRTSGVVQPGVARSVPDGRIELVCGERRFRACQELDLPDMPLMVRADMTDAEAQEIVAIENLQREGLNEIEEAQGYADWIRRLTSNIQHPTSNIEGETGQPQCQSRKEAIEYIESRIHRKRATIYERLRLTELTKEEAALLTSGKISASVASLLPTVPDPAGREKLRKHLETQADYGNPVSVRDFEEMIEDEHCKPLREAPFKLDADYQHEKRGLLVTCQDCPQRTGNMLDQFPHLKSRPNVCTNPVCYRWKQELEADAELNKARASGKTVLTAKEFKARKDEFVRADEYVYAKGKSGPWDQLMGKHKPEPVIVGTTDGLRTVYPKAEALAACKKNKVEFRTETKQKHQSPEEYEKEQAKKKVTLDRRNKLVETTAARLLQFIRKLTPKQGWELAYEQLVHRYDRSERHLKGDTAAEKVLAHVFNQRQPVYYTGEWSKDDVKLWKRAGVDLLAEEKKVLAEEAKKAKAPDEFVKEILGWAKKAGFKPLTEQFSVIANCAARHDLPDISECKTEEQRQALLKAFRGECEDILKAPKAKPTKTKKAKAQVAPKKGKKK